MQIVTTLSLLFAVATVSLAHHPESHEAAAPVVPAQVDSSPAAVVGSSQPVVDSAPVVHHQIHHHQVVGGQHQAPSYYAPAGVIQVVGEQGPSKPAGAVRPQQFASAEQYGQPEAGSIPANYKPFGSWGLYIGGNPADGYYTNYYKALSNSVQDKPASSAAVGPEPAGAKPISPASALGPVGLRQASSSPYVGADYYPFATYSTSELNTGVAPQHVIPGHYSAGQVVSPVQAGAQVYGTPSSFEPASVFAYADSYATKRIGQQQQVVGLKEPQQVQREVVQPVPQFVQQPQQVKGQHQYVAAYPSPYSSLVYAAGPAAASGHSQVVSHQQPQSQVVAYPVPVGSQIVGSQQGVDGAFQPYGVHAFTRYAVKPTTVHSDQSYYHHFPTYKQVGSSAPAQVVHQPLSYYGYPLSQLHYSSHGPVSGAQSVVVESPPASVGAADVAPVVAEASEEKLQKKPLSSSSN